MANLVTGDAITLELRVAAFPSRFLALCVDLFLQISILVALGVLTEWIFSSGGSEGAAAALYLSGIVVALVVYPTAVETLSRGRSVGKAMMGLRVLRDDGGPVRMRHALVRALAMVFIDLWTTSGVVGGLSCLASSRSKRVGDHLAGTIVVGERLPRSASAGSTSIAMPPQLAAWAATLDLVAVPDQLALGVRTFLTRYPSLDPRQRDEIAARLATEVAQHVRTPAPYGTPAWAYLSAVSAERTRRSLLAAGRPAPAQWAPNPGSAPAQPAAPPYPQPQRGAGSDPPDRSKGGFAVPY